MRLATSELRVFGLTAVCAGVVGFAGCSDGDEPVGELSDRAYVISELSDDLFVVDLASLRAVATIDIGPGGEVSGHHMAVLSSDGARLYVTATERDALVVVDTVSLEVVGTIPVGKHPTHANACRGCAPGGGDELWVVNEDDGAIAVVDMQTDDVVDTIADESMVVPHFVRFANGRAYVPSIGGNQITVIDLATREVDEVLLVSGAKQAGPCSEDPCGFADAQIDERGILVAAHIETGAVLMYETAARERLADLTVGNRPWAVFVDTLSDVSNTYMMPNWGDATVSVLVRVELAEVARSEAGDYESYGVNYSPLAPGAAFVMNRARHRVAVVGREDGALIDAIDVGGTTETASTTGDGRYLLVPVSSADAFSVIDVAAQAEVARFEGVGDYPWSVTTIDGQSYCH